jgi:uncharacterized protein YecT (DUF1311 family)
VSEQCIGKEADFTEKHLNAFLEAVRGILTDEGAPQTAMQAPGKRNQLEPLNKADRAWREYKKNLCELQFAGFGGGTIGPAADQFTYPERHPL